MDLSILKDLREQTGAGVADCKKALEESCGDMAKAVEILRKKGALKAAKKLSERMASDGLIGHYVHSTGKIASLVMVNCETDFVARSDVLRELARDLAMQVASENPLYITSSDVPLEVVEKEKEIYREQLREQGKEQEMIEKILDGKIAKYYADVCLMEQTFIKDDKRKVKDIINEAVLKVGEKIEVKKFVRFGV